MHLRDRYPVIPFAKHRPRETIREPRGFPQSRCTFCGQGQTKKLKLYETLALDMGVDDDNVVFHKECFREKRKKISTAYHYAGVATARLMLEAHRYQMPWYAHTGLFLDARDD